MTRSVPSRSESSLVIEQLRSKRVLPLASWEALRLVSIGCSGGAEALDRLADSEILRALRDLPEEFRMAVYLADIEGYAYKEIAEIMDTPIGTVMSRLHRGRKKIREQNVCVALLADLRMRCGDYL